jgi:NAD dependent epimerase/dehydratase
MDWAGRRVLVTGAGGFIGSHLVEKLVSLGAAVRAMVRYNSRGEWGHLDGLAKSTRDALEVVAGDVRDPFFVDRVGAGVDVIFHLASLIAIPYSYEAPQSYVETIVSGALHVLEAAKRHRVSRVVHISTSEVYGTALYTPIDEKHPLQGQSPYSACKIGADKLAESFHRSFGLPVTILRPFNTFGPRQSARAVIPTIISQALARDHVELGALTPVRDLLYVEDTVAAMVRAAEADAVLGETIHVGSGRGISIGELARVILAKLGLERPVRTQGDRVRPEASEVMTLVCDPSKAKQLLGWAPRVSFDEGLERAIAWVRAHPDAYRAEVYNR